MSDEEQFGRFVDLSCFSGRSNEFRKFVRRHGIYDKIAD